MQKIEYRPAITVLFRQMQSVCVPLNGHASLGDIHFTVDQYGQEVLVSSFGKNAQHCVLFPQDSNEVLFTVPGIGQFKILIVRD